MSRAKFTFFSPSLQDTSSFPLFLSKVRAGFPSPADGEMEAKLDLNKHLIKHKAATFFVRVEGDSMQNASIKDGDILIVDRAISPENGKIVLALLNGDFTVKRLKKEKEKGKLFLLPENDSYPAIEVTDGLDFQIWGVITYIIHQAN